MQSILILEDDENLNRGISLKLGREGYQVFSASSVSQGKRIFLKEKVEMVISDINLPDGSGLDFGNWGRENSAGYLLYLTPLDPQIDIKTA